MARVLCLEDDPSVAELVRRTLVRAGLTVELELANDKASFTRAWNSRQFDLVLSDHDVPGYSGHAALREVRAREPRTPFVFVCAFGGKEREIECMEAGADDFVLKDELWRLPYVVRRWLGMSRHSSALPSSAVIVAGDATSSAGSSLQADNRPSDVGIEREAFTKDFEAYAYAVTHDLRNPVGQVMGFADLLREDLAEIAPAIDLTYIDHILSASTRMNAIIEDLVKLAHVDRVPMMKQAVDLSAIAREIAARLETSAPSRHVKWSLPDRAMVNADPEMMRTVIEALLSNAHKFTSAAAVATVELGTGGRVDGQDAFFVRDNGAGFDMNHAKRLFVPYGRLHSQHEFAGDGVALAMARRIVHRHGGRMWAESRVGHGATFYFSLPAQV